LPKLEEGGFDAWEQAVGHIFYGAGWYHLYAFSLKDELDEDERKKLESTPSQDLECAWASVIMSIVTHATLLRRVESIEKGDVAALLKQIRSHFVKATVHTRAQLRDDLHEVRLADHDTLQDYICAVQSIISNLARLGSVCSDEDRVYYLLRGLPSDYDIVKQAIRVRGDKLDDDDESNSRWAAAVWALEDFASYHPVMGSKRRKEKDVAYLSSTTPSREVCRDFLRGRCKRGTRCRFRHVTPPNLSNPAEPSMATSLPCGYCRINGHYQRLLQEKTRR
jgi:hypothetical protein